MSKAWVRIISVLEIIGGIVGIGFVIWWLLATPINFLTIVLTPIPIGIYVLSLVAGVALWRGDPFGRTASIIVQAIQFPKIVSPLLIFMFSFGFDLWIHMLFAQGFVTVGVETRFLAFNQFFINSQDAPVGLGVSVTAAISLAMLFKYRPPRIEEGNTLQPAPRLSTRITLLNTAPTTACTRRPACAFMEHMQEASDATRYTQRQQQKGGHVATTRHTFLRRGRLGAVELSRGGNACWPRRYTACGACGVLDLHRRRGLEVNDDIGSMLSDSPEKHAESLIALLTDEQLCKGYQSCSEASAAL